jgi:hypothetical protein
MISHKKEVHELQLLKNRVLRRIFGHKGSDRQLDKIAYE